MRLKPLSFLILACISYLPALTWAKADAMPSDPSTHVDPAKVKLCREKMSSLGISDDLGRCDRYWLINGRCVEIVKEGFKNSSEYENELDHGQARALTACEYGDVKEDPKLYVSKLNKCLNEAERIGIAPEIRKACTDLWLTEGGCAETFKALRMRDEDLPGNCYLFKGDKNLIADFAKKFKNCQAHLKGLGFTYDETLNCAHDLDLDCIEELLSYGYTKELAARHNYCSHRTGQYRHDPEYLVLRDTRLKPTDSFVAAGLVVIPFGKDKCNFTEKIGLKALATSKQAAEAAAEAKAAFGRAKNARMLDVKAGRLRKRAEGMRKVFIAFREECGGRTLDQIGKIEGVPSSKVVTDPRLKNVDQHNDHPPKAKSNSADAKITK